MVIINFVIKETLETLSTTNLLCCGPQNSLACGGRDDALGGASHGTALANDCRFFCVLDGK